MKKRLLTEKMIVEFRLYLINEEKSLTTIYKYIHDVRSFALYSKSNPITKDIVLSYKQHLKQKYAVRSVNSKLASLNSLFAFLDLNDCKVKSLKLQKQTYSSMDRQLTKSEYLRLLNTSKHNNRLSLILKTICGMDHSQ